MSSGALDLLLRAAREGLLLAVLLSVPPLLASMVVGFVVGIAQTAMQLHDQTLGSVPKLLAVTLTLLAMGPALGAQVLRFAHAMFLAAAAVGR